MDPREDAIVGTPPAPEELANWLLHHASEGGQSPADFVVVSESAYGRLRAELSIFFGQAGFDALWSRAMALLEHSVGTESVGVDTIRLRTSGWSDALNGRPQEQQHSAVVAAFTSFISLLFTFVGAEIGSRLLHQAWPELLQAQRAPAAGSSTGDVTP